MNPHPVPVMDTIRQLRSEYNKNPSEATGKTFRQYATQKLGKTLYDSFVISAGYTDYENEDVYETLYYYGMEDNEPGWTLLSIPWNKLLKALIQKIDRKNIHMHCEVTQLKLKDKTEDGLFHIISQNENKEKTEWKAAHVVIASKTCVVQNLIPGGKKPDSLYRQIHAQPFLRVYVKANENTIPILKQYIPITTLVPGAIHKIIPMSKKKGIYMIGYTDNQGALELEKIKENTPGNRKIWANKIEDIFGLEKGVIEFDEIRSFFWPCGTHYYSPLKQTKIIKNRDDFIYQAQNPLEGVWVIGEMVSRNQGWVEGALESVRAVL